MNYKVVYIPLPDINGKWFETEQEAWDYIATIGHGQDYIEPCEMCQAEYEVFSRQDIYEIQAEMDANELIERIKKVSQ